MIHKYYKNIEDCPIWNLQKVNETGDLRYLLKRKNYDKLPSFLVKKKKLYRYYEVISEEIVDIFGFDERFITKKRTEKELLVLTLRIILGEKHLKAIKSSRERVIEDTDAIESKAKVNFEEQVIMLEKHFNTHINTKKVSVKKFYTYLEVIKKENEYRKKAEKSDK